MAVVDVSQQVHYPLPITIQPCFLIRRNSLVTIACRDWHDLYISAITHAAQITPSWRWTDLVYVEVSKKYRHQSSFPYLGEPKSRSRYSENLHTRNRVLLHFRPLFTHHLNNIYPFHPTMSRTTLRGIFTTTRAPRLPKQSLVDITLRRRTR